MTIPEEIWKLGEKRKSARAVKDFAEADRIRDELLNLGWEVIDVSGEFQFKKKSRYVEVENISALKPAFKDEKAVLAMIVDGFTEDALETVNSVRKYSKIPIYIISLGDVGALEDAIGASVIITQVKEDCGWGQAANGILRAVESEYVVMMDPSTRFESDAITPIIAEIEKQEFVAVGWRGGLINLEDEWRSVDDKGDGEVDVLFSYFLAIDRLSAVEVGGFNVRAHYYRNADIEFSLRLRQTGGRLLQLSLPLTQARHHGYYDVDVDYREVQSKKNYDRILERFRGKNAILSPRR